MGRIKQKPKKNKKGVTMVELVVAFALLAIVAMMLSGTIVYIFRTSMWTSSKTEIVMNTYGELINQVNGGAHSAEVDVAIANSTVSYQFDGLSAIVLPVGVYTATSVDVPLNGSRQETYKAFRP